MKDFWLLPALLSLFAWLLTGCAVGDYGTLVSRYTRTRTATVLDVYALGWQVRPDATDRGLTLGWRKSSYVFANPVGSGVKGTHRWSWFQAPWPEGDLVLRANTTAGIEVQATPDIRRTHLGYLNQMMTRTPLPGEDIALKVHFDNQNPGSTQALLINRSNSFGDRK